MKHTVCRALTIEALAVVVAGLVPADCFASHGAYKEYAGNGYAAISEPTFLTPQQRINDVFKTVKGHEFDYSQREKFMTVLANGN